MGSRTYSTRQARAVLAYLDEQPSFQDARRIHLGLLDQGHRVSLSTVYRRLEALVAARELEVIQSPLGVATYRRCHRDEGGGSPGRAGATHLHQHLVCRECGRVEEASDPRLHDLVVSVAVRAGFGDLTPSLDIVGVCGSCRRA